jgi:hypothetical protein
VFDQLLDELQPSPDATMSDERGAVRAIPDSRLNFFEDVNTHNRHIYRNGAVHNGDIARGGKGLPLFSASSEAQRSRQRAP